MFVNYLSALSLNDTHFILLTDTVMYSLLSQSQSKGRIQFSHKLLKHAPAAPLLPSQKNGFRPNRLHLN